MTYSSIANTFSGFLGGLSPRYLGLCIFGFCLGLLVLNSPMAALLFPFAILFVFGVIVVPELAFLSIVAFIPVALELFGGLTVTTTVMPLAFLSLSLNASIRRCQWPISLASTTEKLAFLFFFAVALSSLQAKEVVDTIKDTLAAGVYFMIFMTTATQIKTEKQLIHVLWVLIGMGVIEALITVAQVKIGFTLPGSWRLTNLEGTDVTEEFRADGTTSHPIMLAHYLQFTIVVGAAVFFWSRSAVIRLCLIVGVLMMMLGWYYAFSRTSFIAVAATVCAYFFVRNKTLRGFMIVGAVVLLVLIWLLNIRSFRDVLVLVEGWNIFSRSASHLDINPSENSYGFRTEQFYAGWKLFLDNPIIGVGFDQTENRYMPYLPYWATNASHPQVIHNIFIKVLCEQGLVGLTLFVALWASVLRSIKKIWFHPQYGRYAQLVFFILFGQLIMGSMNPMFREIWLSLGLAAAIGKLAETAGNRASANNGSVVVG